MKRDYLFGEKSDWTDDEINVAVRMWKDGEAASKIAKALPGRSRNSVLGKMNRMGLLRYDAGPKKPASTPKRQYSKRPPKAAIVRAPRICKPEYTGNLTFPEVRGLPEALIRRADRQCGYPLGEPSSPDFHYCTAERDCDHVYCPEHRSATSGGFTVFERKADAKSPVNFQRQ